MLPSPVGSCASARAWHFSTPARQAGKLAIAALYSASVMAWIPYVLLYAIWGYDGICVRMSMHPLRIPTVSTRRAIQQPCDFVRRLLLVTPKLFSVKSLANDGP